MSLVETSSFILSKHSFAPEERKLRAISPAAENEGEKDRGRWINRGELWLSANSGPNSMRGFDPLVWALSLSAKGVTVWSSSDAESAGEVLEVEITGPPAMLQCRPVACCPLLGCPGLLAAQDFRTFP